MIAYDNNEQKWMRRALELAERGRGWVEPNPLVGAVLVRDGQNVGEGWHERFGMAHAEVNALRSAGESARNATLYVTLEPCCHHGKTPPCTEAIIRSGVRRVVAAMSDPFPQVAGGGIALLRKAGIEVEVGHNYGEAQELNAPYLKLLTTGFPYVHAKWAMSLDGKVATRTGDAKWISNETSRRRAHALRGRMDAIVVGRGTVEKDDALLTARPPGPRTPVRVVLSSRGSLARNAQLVATAGQSPVLVATHVSAEEELVSMLRNAGCEVIQFSASDRIEMIPELLAELGRRRMTNILVEGGPTVLGSFHGAGAIDEVHVFIAPRLLGGEQALGPIGGAGIGKIADAVRLTDLRAEELDGDWYIHGRVSRLDTNQEE